MNRFVFLILSIACSISVLRADDFSTMKSAITAQLLSDNPNDAIVAELAVKYFPDGVDTDQCLMELVAHAMPQDSDIANLLSTQHADGSWDGIYYTSPARSAWEAQAHIKNIMKFARGYKSPNSSYCNDKQVLEAINRAIDYWCDNGFTCTNWWYNAIGVPKVFAPVLLLLEGDLSSERMAKGMQVLEPAEREMTGQNKVWCNGIILIKGLLLGDAAVVDRATTAIRSELILSREEGIQYDYSYHQHGAMQQFGNYGLAFAASMSYWMRIFDGTSYDFTAEQKQIMSDYMTRGLNVTIWRGHMDVSSCGRQLFYNSQTGKAASVLISNLNMLAMGSSANTDYEGYVKRNYITPDQNDLKGNFTYPISKYTIHRADEFMFSVKMFSKRIIGGEIMNNENLKGYHLADGATMIYRTGAEYDNMFAYWDGKYMPGTTVEVNDKPLKVLANSYCYLNGSDFVGCMGDGMYGVAAMEYLRDGVEANKSWFFFDDEVVCLGNGIASQSGDPFVTTLNQCRYQDVAYYNAGGRRIEPLAKGESYSAQRVFSDGVGYESLDRSPIDFVVREQSGDWHDVALFIPSTISRGDVFTAQIFHGESYAYVVKPSVDGDDFLMGRSKNSFRVIQNTSTVTAVESLDRDLAMVVFWEAGEVKTKRCGTISASAPVMVIVKREGGELVTQLYDPLESGAEVVCR
ncbi:MAG: polysaccharide lyase family 8 super-sandwich domain-containing protein [Rikenellaceae bacterium]